MQERSIWDVARCTVGYWRYDTAGGAGRVEPDLAHVVAADQPVHPQQKLVSKTRAGAKVIKRYDTAQNPPTSGY
jgi:hypothetical protein